MKMFTFSHISLVKRIIKLLLCVCLAFTYTLSSGQSWTHLIDSVPDNYFDLRQQLEDYYNENDSLKDQEGSGYKEFVRWTLFWDGRIDQNGSYTTANQNLFAHYEDLKKGGSPSNNLPFQPDWEALGPLVNEQSSKANMGLVACLWIDTTDFQTIYAGSNSGGLFVTYNGGNTWSSLTDNIGALGIRDIIVQPDDTNTIYIATGTRSLETHYGYGVLKSTDGGSTWEETAFNPSGGPNKVIISRIINHPDSATCFYALGIKHFGKKSYIFKTYDSFETIDTLVTLTEKELFDIEFKPDDPSTIYVSGHVLCKSSDYGMSWDTSHHNNLGLNQNHKIERIAIAVHDDSASMVLAICQLVDTTDPNAWNYYKGLYRSYDNGINYSEITPGLDEYGFEIDFDVGYWNMEFEISPNDINTFFTGGIWMDKYRIIDDTARLLDIPTNYHMDVRKIKLYEGDTTEIVYMGNDGGVTKSDVGGWEWDDCSKYGLNITQYYKFGLSDISPIVLGGTQDGNFERYNHNTNTWDNDNGFGDAGEMLLDYADPKIMYASGFPSEWIQKSEDGGKNFDFVFKSDTIDKYGYKIPPLLMDPIDHNTIYFGLHNIYKSDDQAENWEAISDFSDDLGIKSSAGLIAMAISKSNPDVIYAGFTNPTWGDTVDTIRLVKTINGGSDWTDITNSNYSQYCGISDIEIHPTDPSKFWLSFYQHCPTRVVCFEQYGDTSYNISDQLPLLPVNGLIYYKHDTIDELFAGTDAGVYYYNDNLNYWQAFNDGLPLSMVSDLEINYRTNKLVVSTFGRGMWQTDLPCSDSSTIYIRTNTTWDSIRSICYDIVIDSGAILTITGDVYMLYPDLSILVKPGAKLVVDSGSIQSGCYELWEGIEVWGDPELEQNPMNQGTVVIKDQGTIKDAELAIYAGKKAPSGGPASMNNGGGIVVADEAIFKNNKTAIIFDPFADHNISWIENSTFANEKGEDNFANFEQFIRFTGVKGIRIKGSTFNNKNRIITSNEWGRGIGINCINSQIYIEENITANGMTYDTTYCSFEGLKYGIKAMVSTSSKTITIDSSFFYQNDCGIYLGGISYATIRKNTFEIWEGDSLYVTDTISGIYLDECGAYMVEENSFFGQYSQEGNDKYWTGIGLVINNSGPYPNEIYNNYFEDCYVGTIAQNKNRDRSGDYGLQILCNDYVNCEYDIAVTADDTGDEYGIKAIQGSDGEEAYHPANCTFSWVDEQLTGDFHNECNEIEYWHLPDTITAHTNPIYHSSSVEPANNSENPNDYDKDDCCPPDTLSGGGIEELKSLLISTEVKADFVQDLLNTLVDGGDTDALKNEVELSSSQQALWLKQNLIDESPYLSDTVMVSATKKENVLTNEMITEILSSNPQAAKSDTVQQALDDRSNELTTEQRTEIDQGWFITGAKESLEMKISSYNAQKSKEYNHIIRYYINGSSSSEDQDSLYKYLEKGYDLINKYTLVFEHLNKQDSNNAEIVLNEITLSGLSENELIQHQLFEDYIDIMVGQLADDKSFCDLDSLALSEVEEIFDAAIGMLRTFVRNLLIEADNLEYSEPYLFPDNLKSTKIRRRPVRKSYSSNYLRIYPNPAYDWIVIDYSIVENFENGLIRFFDSQGKLFKQVPVTCNHDYIVFPLTDFKTGVYLCNFITDSKVAESAKLVVLNK